jgi:hypothetical protein
MNSATALQAEESRFTSIRPSSVRLPC